MTPQQPQIQLSSAQLNHAIKNLEARVKAKTLECASLEQMMKATPGFFADIVADHDGDWRPMSAAVYNLLTAKLNTELVNLEELELRLKATKAMGNMVQPAVVA